MMIAGSMVAVGLLPLGIIMGWDHSLDPAAIGWAALVLVALLVTLIGCSTMRFEFMGTANKNSAANGSQPIR